LLNRKRYAGLYWTNENKYDKIDTKGIETVRRDNCNLIRTMLKEILELILVKNDVKNINYILM
jgi:DNA polymerase delta subunit 1